MRRLSAADRGGLRVRRQPGPAPRTSIPYLTPESIERLKAGEVFTVEKIRTDDQGNTLGGGFVVAMVERPPDVVWTYLSNYAAYPEFMPSVKSLEFYDDEGPTYGLHYQLKILFSTIEYYVLKHPGPGGPQHRLGTWTTAGRTTSTPRSAAGGFAPLDEGRSLLLYQVNVDTVLVSSQELD